MKISIEQAAENIIVFLSGEMDALGCTEIRSELESLTEGHSSDLVTLNLEKVSFIDSSGIGAIVFLFKRLSAAGSRLRVTGVYGQPRELMELLRIDKAIEVQWESQPSLQMAL